MVRVMRIVKLAAAFGISFAAAAIGSLGAADSIPTWYAGLDKPFFNPPNALFGPVWTVLYALIAVSLYLVWAAKTEIDRTRAYWWFGVQMALNTVWSLVFFGMHEMWAAAIIIFGLIATIIGTMYSFWPVSRTAVYLLMPYLAWVCFATLLNLSIAILNS